MNHLDWMRVGRIAAGVSGLLLATYGVFRLLAEVPGTSLLRLAGWLLGALLISDLVVSPLVVMVGAALRRWLPDRGRRYVQGFLIMAVVIIVVAAPLLYLEGSAPPEKALLQQDFGANLAILLGLAALISLLGYATERLRSRRSSASRG